MDILNEPLDLQIMKYHIPIIYLDTNILIEMAKAIEGRCKDKKADKILYLYKLLKTKMEEERLLCPLGNQLQEMGIAKVRSDARKFLLTFTNSKLKSPDEIKSQQLDIAFSSFKNNDKSISLFASDIMEIEKYNDYVIEAFHLMDKTELSNEKLKKDSIVETLNEMKKSNHICNNLDEQIEREKDADYQAMEAVLRNRNKDVIAFGKYLDYIGVMYSRMGLTPNNENRSLGLILLEYMTFLKSIYHDIMPCVDITSILWAYRMQDQKHICSGDNMDTIWAASYLPFVNYAFTDKAFDRIIKEMSLDSKYKVKTFSLGLIEDFILEIEKI